MVGLVCVTFVSPSDQNKAQSHKDVLFLGRIDLARHVSKWTFLASKFKNACRNHNQGKKLPGNKDESSAIVRT